MRIIRAFVGAAALALGLATVPPAAVEAAESGVHLKDLSWPTEGLFGTFDRAAVQRGFQVYREVCQACHGLEYVAFRTLGDIGYNEDENAARIAADLEAVFDVPVQVSAVLGRSKMDVGDLLKLGPGTVLELDRRVGEAIDIYVNNRLVARGEVVLVEDKLGVTMTEIIKAERS